MFVPYAAPGDRLEARIVRSRKRYDEAAIVRIVEGSDKRIDPPCPYYGRCGGCHLQHLNIEQQRLEKQRIFFDLMTSQGKVPPDAIGEMLFTEGLEFGYRTRLDLGVRVKDSGVELGFAQRGTRKVVLVETCLLAAEPLRPLFSMMRDLLSQARVEEVSRLVIASDDPALPESLGPGTIVLLKTKEGLSRETRDILSEKCSKTDRAPGLKGVYVESNRTKKIEPVWERIPGESCVRFLVPDIGDGGDLVIETDPGVFMQGNPYANRLIIQTAYRWIESDAPDRILDLYAGMGNFSLTVGSLGKTTVGVEISKRAVSNAKRNAERLGKKNVRRLRDSAEGGVKRMLDEDGRFDLVLLDPPRTGAKEVLDGVTALDPRRILYISCDPATLARDVRYLQEHGLYKVIQSRPVDMFPQTFHMESLTLLERNRRIA